MGDQRRLQQIMINLVKNALKFTWQGKIEIMVAYDHVDQNLVVKVKDTGMGIAAEDTPQLFSMFGKLQRTAAVNNDGIGLGLTIVKQLVEYSGGKITVESPGLHQGSTFTFNLPLKMVENEDSTTLVEAASPDLEVT